MGVAGGAAGFLVFAQAAVYVLFAQSDQSKLWSFPSLLLAGVYVPAIWVSVVSTERRQIVLRSTLGVTLLIAVLGGYFIDILLVGLLMMPTTLLAIAGGLVFQGRAKR